MKRLLSGTDLLSSSIFVAGAAPTGRTLLDVLADTIRERPDHAAIDAGTMALAYRELAVVVDALAARLRDHGIGVGDRVGIRVPSGTAELYVAILGALGAGAAYVPVDADDPPARAEEIWARAGVCAVIGDGLLITELAPARGEARRPTPDDDAWIIFTSGSTGVPKGVAVTHRSAAAFVDAETLLWHIDSSDRVMAGLSVAFDASCEEMWLAWRNGATLVPAPRSLVRSGPDLGPWIVARGVTVVSTVPTLAATWDGAALAGVRHLIFGGEVCPPELVARLAVDREVWNTYGPTEATVVSCGTRVRPGEPIRIGLPLAGWLLAVIGTDGEPVPMGEAGELVIGGVGLGRYLDPVLDAERFAPLASLGWPRAYRTGDMVRGMPDGITYIGRVDDQVKIRGRRIELGEVEAALTAIPGVRAAAAAVKRTPSGTDVLVGYVIGDVDPAAVRHELVARLPAELVPVIAPVAELPVRSSGKVDRAALPWPLPSVTAPGAGRGTVSQLTGTAAWLAERFGEQLGPIPLDAGSDFFALGGNSLAAATLVSTLRGRFPSVAVADVYAHPRICDLTTRLEAIGAAGRVEAAAPIRRQLRWQLAQLAGVGLLFVLQTPLWLIGLLAFNDLAGRDWAPAVSDWIPTLDWPWVVAGWVIFSSVPARVLIAAGMQRLLLRGLAPGRYPRGGGLHTRLWLVDRIAATSGIADLRGTPWAARTARLFGNRVGRGVSLDTSPSITGLVEIGDGASIESDVDIDGWWIDGNDLVVGAIRIGAGSRVGARSVLLPGAEIGDGAELEAGSCLAVGIPAEERWGGSPARRLGTAGDLWPAGDAPTARHARFWQLAYGGGVLFLGLLLLLAAVPGLILISILDVYANNYFDVLGLTILAAPIIAATFLVAYAAIVAVVVRLLSGPIKPGYHPSTGGIAWCAWLSERLLDDARGILFPIYASVFTPAWLRALGASVGHRAEISTAHGLPVLMELGDETFIADDVGLGPTRTWRGWLHLGGVRIGDRAFVGNSAIVGGGVELAEGSLVGVLSSAPERSRAGSSWIGLPPLEVPRVADVGDESRTYRPPRRLVIARGAVELVRIILPGTLSIFVGECILVALDTIGGELDMLPMILSAPFVIAGAAVLAGTLTVALKWLIAGRYRPGDRPLWSHFVWRNELVNALHEELAGPWLLDVALGTPIMSAYLRAMGTRVGANVWCETWWITEFDLVELEDGATVNRSCDVQTHLFHDRVMRVSGVRIGRGASLGPHSVVLPGADVGDECRVGARSLVMRGEALPPRTRWNGSPVVAA